MRIERLVMKNFRAIQAMEIDFHENLNVLIGTNGAGKTSLLDGLAIMLSWVVKRLGFVNASGKSIDDIDITNGQSFSSIQVNGSAGGMPVDWRLTRTRKGHSQGTEKSDFSSLNAYTKSIQEKITTRAQRVDLPLFAYYPVNRAVLDIPLRIRKSHRFELLDAYEESLQGKANFRTFFEWFREREDLENEHLRHTVPLFENGSSTTAKTPSLDPQLEAVRKAIEQFLPGFQQPTVRRNPLRMEIQKHGQTLNIAQLSDGEKCLMAMVSDIAMRMAIANPTLANPLEGEGVILIDEIDLHLHPKWQRMIVPKLLEVYPKCQFIITTHSPHVITHVQPENLFILEDTGHGVVFQQPSESYGKNADRILEDLMGLKTTRPSRVQDTLREIYRNIDQGQLEEARELVKKSIKEIGEDPELVKAEVLIKRKEIIGK